MDPKVKGGNLQRAAREALQLGKTVPFAQLVVTRPKLTNAERKLIAEAAMAAAATAQDENTGQDAAKAKGKKKNRGNIRGPLYHTEGRLLGSEAISFAGVSDVRQLVSDWIRKEQNPYFARAFVNRVWARYFGVGIVNPIDDLNLANPPSNAELLDYLARGFVEHDYDMKWLHREIANSRTYQTSWVPNASNSLDQRNFSRAIPRRLPAELVVDALAFACAPDEMNNEFLSAVQDRSIAVPGTNGNSAKFAGRSAGYALQAFGRSTRNNNCDCDRSNETSLIQTVYLQNDQDVHFWLTHPKGWVAQKAMATESQDEVKVDQKRLETVNRRLAQLQRSAKNMKLQESNQALKKIISRIQQLTSQRDTIQQRIDESQESSSKVDVTDLITEAYLRTVGRFPTAVEVERCRIYIEESSSLMQGLTGVMWALINTKEFIVNH
jgi:hypothetical protein